MNNTYPTPDELAAKALEAFRRRQRRTPDEEFTDMVRKGFINAKGEVTRLIGGSAEPEPNYQNWTSPDADNKVKKNSR
jgi:hypothetical protein